MGLMVDVVVVGSRIESLAVLSFAQLHLRRITITRCLGSSAKISKPSAVDESCLPCTPSNLLYSIKKVLLLALELSPYLSARL